MAAEALCGERVLRRVPAAEGTGSAR